MAINSKEIDRLIAAGRYAEAARAAENSGEHLRAAEIYEQIWKFRDAARCARTAGDLPTALLHAIDARDEALIRELRDELCAGGQDGARAALEVFAKRRRFAEAGRAAELVGEDELAIDYYRQAQLYLEASRLSEAAGRDREAGLLLEKVVEHGDDPAESAEAELRLGLLLARRMQHDEAVRHLQVATRRDSTRDRAERALVLELVAIGLRDAARDVLTSARARDDSLPADLDDFVARERQREREGGGRSDAEADRERGQEVVGGRYRLERFLGSGGSGRVFAARDEVTGRAVAVKLFNMAQARARQVYERFVREARVAGSLRHPNLVEVYDFSAESGYTAMELMVGGSLCDRLTPRMTGTAVRRMCLDVLAGLALAHQRGIIHRDVKPANIFFDARGTAKLGDFGVAHLLDLGQTQTGGLIGTLAYMSPEQITGARLTIAADLYAIGVTLFEALTGRLPFLGPDFVAQHLGDTPPPPSEVAPEVAAGWDPLIATLLEKDPDGRYDSIDLLCREIEAIDLGEVARPRPLVLPRASASAHRHAAASDNAQPPSMEPVDDAADRSRYEFETAIGRTEISSLSRAVDSVLNRSVIIERFEPGAVTPEIERRLYALARGGGPFLQRALAYDRQAGVAVFEAPAGTPLSETPAAGAFASNVREAARLLQRLARAVAQLHEQGNAHGSITEGNVLLDESGIPTLLVCGLGVVEEGASPSSDVSAILSLVSNSVAIENPNARVEPLLDALLPASDAHLRAAILARKHPRNGEELHALALAMEVAVLKSSLRRPLEPTNPVE